MSFALTPPRPPRGAMSTSSPAYTPSKMLLMNSERRMNMLTPSQASKVINADLETGKVSFFWDQQLSMDAC